MPISGSIYKTVFPIFSLFSKIKQSNTPAFVTTFSSPLKEIFKVIEARESNNQEITKKSN